MGVRGGRPGCADGRAGWVSRQRDAAPANPGSLANARISHTPASCDVRTDSSTSATKNRSFITPAPKVTVARTMPGPPRAFIATAKWTDHDALLPAQRAPNHTLPNLITQASTNNQLKK